MPEKKCTVHSHSDFKKCFNLSQTLFWRKEHNVFFSQFYKIHKFNFSDEKMPYRIISIVYAICTNPSQYRAGMCRTFYKKIRQLRENFPPQGIEHKSTRPTWEMLSHAAPLSGKTYNNRPAYLQKSVINVTVNCEGSEKVDLLLIYCWSLS